MRLCILATLVVCVLAAFGWFVLADLRAGVDGRPEVEQGLDVELPPVPPSRSFVAIEGDEGGTAVREVPFLDSDAVAPRPVARQSIPDAVPEGGTDNRLRVREALKRLRPSTPAYSRLEASAEVARMAIQRQVERVEAWEADFGHMEADAIGPILADLIRALWASLQAEKPDTGLLDEFDNVAAALGGASIVFNGLSIAVERTAAALSEERHWVLLGVLAVRSERESREVVGLDREVMVASQISEHVKAGYSGAWLLQIMNRNSASARLSRNFGPSMLREVATLVKAYASGPMQPSSFGSLADQGFVVPSRVSGVAPESWLKDVYLASNDLTRMNLWLLYGSGLDAPLPAGNVWAMHGYAAAHMVEFVRPASLCEPVSGATVGAWRTALKAYHGARFFGSMARNTPANDDPDWLKLRDALDSILDEDRPAAVDDWVFASSAAAWGFPGGWSIQRGAIPEHVLQRLETIAGGQCPICATRAVQAISLFAGQVEAAAALERVALGPHPLPALTALLELTAHRRDASYDFGIRLSELIASGDIGGTIALIHRLVDPMFKGEAEALKQTMLGALRQTGPDWAAALKLLQD